MISTIGNRAHDFGKCSPNVLATRINDKNLTSIQLALNKAIIDIDTLENISVDQLKYIKSEMDAKDIKISVLGCYLNYGYPDDRIREDNISMFKKHIDYAKILGARVVGTETGSYTSDFKFHPWNHTEEAYALIKKSFTDIATYAEEKGVDIAIEPVAHHTINTLKKLRRLIDDIGSKRIKVIFDPVNLLTPKNHHEQLSIMDEAFSLFAEELIIIHAKGYKCQDDKILEVPPCEGDLDYDYLRKLIQASEQSIDILIENVKPEALKSTISYILG